MCALSLLLWPAIGLAFFPRTDAGQFVINLKAPSGTRIEATNDDVARVESVIRSTVDPRDLKLIASNIGVVPDFSAIYTSNAGPHTATVQVALNDDRHATSFEYTDRVRELAQENAGPSRCTFSRAAWWTPSLTQGVPAPIDVQV